MTAPLPIEPIPDGEDRLSRRAADLRQTVTRLVDESGDLDMAFDQIADELFGKPEEAQALLEIVLEDINGVDQDDDGTGNGR